MFAANKTAFEYASIAYAKSKDLTKIAPTVVSVSAMLVLVACTGASNLNQGGFAKPQSAAPLNPAPLTPVQSGALQPTAPPVPTEPNSAAGTEVAALPEATDTQPAAAVTSAKDKTPVSRQGMVGAWTVSTGGSNCQIFLALTKWSGGYRAASRGCSAAAISDVQAWDVKDNKVVLVSSSGSQAATLYRSASERFDGTTSGGGNISFSR